MFSCRLKIRHEKFTIVEDAVMKNNEIIALAPLITCSLVTYLIIKPNMRSAIVMCWTAFGWVRDSILVQCKSLHTKDMIIVSLYRLNLLQN